MLYYSTKEPDYNTQMVRRALIEANVWLRMGRWVRINCLGPNVRLHVGRFNSDGSRQESMITVAFFIENSGKIGREELVF